MIFDMTALVRACLTFYMESYQSDICRFRAMTLSPLLLVVNWPVFLPLIFAVLLLRYNFKCLHLFFFKDF